MLKVLLNILLKLNWLNKISPTIVEIHGQFKLIKFSDSSFRGEEHNAFKKYLIEQEKIKMNNRE